MEIETEVQPKQIIFSAVQPSDTITPGNYLGVVKNWVTMQEDYHCVFTLADLHTIIVRQDPATFHRRTLEAYALFLACGIDPQEHPFFLQSHIHTHVELAWILNYYTQFGGLPHMTQLRDKSAKHADDISAGLLIYPSLMAADILLYQPNLMPVDADQKQHLELARNVAKRSNDVYNPTFTMPEPHIPKVGAHIMLLRDPAHRMSRSSEDANTHMAILDKPDDTVRKFKRAITDNEARVHFAPDKDDVNNLMGIYSSVTSLVDKQVEAELEGKGYGDFKPRVAGAALRELRPIQRRYEKLIIDKTYLEQCCTEDAQQVLTISTHTLSKAMKKIGFLPKKF